MASIDIPRGDIRATERLIEYDSTNARVAKAIAALLIDADELALFTSTNPALVELVGSDGTELFTSDNPALVESVNSDGDELFTTTTPAVVTDWENLFGAILKELRIMSWHLASITGLDINSEDVS